MRHMGERAPSGLCSLVGGSRVGALVVVLSCLMGDLWPGACQTSVYLPTAAALSAPGPLLKVYNDESRQLQIIPASMWAGLRRKDGCLLTRGLGLPQYDWLSQCDVVMIFNRANEDIAYSDEELAAFKRFVEEGGGLYLSAQPGRYLPSPPRGRARKGSRGAPTPIPAADLASQQVAGLFGVAFTRAHGTDTLVFTPGTPMNAGLGIELDEEKCARYEVK